MYCMVRPNSHFTPEARLGACIILAYNLIAFANSINEAVTGRNLELKPLYNKHFIWSFSEVCINQ